ncbi:STAS/SEC14 domain-containing protein [Vibrio sp. IRLE0018]|uniref:STAS/SEC14 domain-containing protein n=1 Tax=Vibrio floridensis TaxID=2908007 RepID=UPI001A282FF8|nr:STAS/SEC14 domain-containing protein [Vibrio floridensis]MCF8779179.1 STAS/SEC14 domain-containing protein [Vibrio floridensis]HAS6347262.1 STAS/SEC14 domain-containing protein [Vibrio vulnificus]
MNTQRHGITFGVNRIGSESILVFKATGTLTHQDYQAITPILDNALQGIAPEQMKMLADITEFSGWEPRAAWDDFQLGLKMGLNIKKIAIYGDKNWQELAAKIGNWFISGEMKSFSDYESAIEWLKN